MRKHKTQLLVGQWSIACCLFLLIGLSSCGNNTASEKKQVEKPQSVEQKADEMGKEAPQNPERPEIVLFDLQSSDDRPKLGFISLSDIDRLSENDDSLAIPDVSAWTYDSAQYFQLDPAYRKRFLHRTGISENDAVFMYDYDADKLVSIPVKKLRVVASLNIYVSPDEAPFSQFDYMIGFEVDRSLLKGFKDLYFNTVLVSIGKESPFVRGQLKPIRWRKTKRSDFPLAKMSRKGRAQLEKKKAGNVYSCTVDSLQYVVQELFHNDRNDSRCLLVLNKKTDRVIFERIYEEGESAGLAPLNYTNPDYGNKEQWAGNLFQNRGPVLFGFVYYSFGCPEISFLEKNAHEIYINCDNRH